MKIHCPKRFLEALDECGEMRVRHNSEMSKKCFRLAKALEGNNEALSLLGDIAYEFVGHRRPFAHETLPNIILRHLRIEANSYINACEKAGRECEMHWYKDFEPLSFGFAQVYEDSGTGIVGGIIYHGNEEDGYQTHHSVQIDPSFGWSQHT